MKTFLISLPILLASFISFGQFQKNDVYSSARNILNYTTAVREVQFSKKGEVVTYYLNQIEGYPHLYEKFNKGIITLHNDSTIEVSVNYNAFVDAFEFEKENTIYTLTNSYSIKEIEIQGKVFVYRAYLNSKGEVAEGYLEVLVTGINCQLYKKFRKNFLDPVPSETHFNIAKPARFSQIESFYFIELGSDIRYLKTNSKNSFITSFKDYKTELKHFVKDNKLNQKKESDLIQIIDFYNSL